MITCVATEKTAETEGEIVPSAKAVAFAQFVADLILKEQPYGLNLELILDEEDFPANDKHPLAELLGGGAHAGGKNVAVEGIAKDNRPGDEYSGQMPPGADRTTSYNWWYFGGKATAVSKALRIPYRYTIEQDGQRVTKVDCLLIGFEGDGNG